MSNNQEHSEIEDYGDPGIRSRDGKIPALLIWSYITLPIWGVIAFYILWNGSTGGWLDPGYWKELQAAAKTSFPILKFDSPTDFSEIVNK